MNYDFNKVKKLASSLLRNESEFPIDVESIAQRNGVSVTRQELESNVSGILVIKNNKAVICVNINHHPNRQRFTIAHELGHFLLHKNETNIFVDEPIILFRNAASSDCQAKKEIEANIFAAELLMPKFKIIKALESNAIDAFDEYEVKNLASKFGVNSQALIIRLTQLKFLSIE